MTLYQPRFLTCFLILLVTTLASSTVSAQEAVQGQTSEGRSIGVVALDDNEGSKRASTRMAEVLVSGGHKVVYGDQVFKRIQEAKSEVSPEVAREFSGISERIAKGVKSFFYEGYDQAIDQLAPLLQLGIKRFSFVAQRPDIAAQLYEAGLVLIRAYEGRDQSKDAEAIASVLVRYFPAQKPTLDSSPPEVIEMIRAARKRVAGDEAAVGIKPIGKGECNSFLNGSRVADGFFPVAAGQEVFVQVECDGTKGPQWKLSVSSGQRVIAPVPVAEINDLNLSDDSFESRREAERVMQAIRFWAGLDEVIGIRHPETEGDAPTLFGHLKDGSVTWTETNDIPALVGYVERTFDIEAKSAYATLGNHEKSETPAQPLDWPGIGLAAGGAVAAGVGVVLIISGKSSEQELICSGFANEAPASGDCDGVENLGRLSQGEFEEKVSSADTRLVLGYTLVGLGAGALGYGIYRLIVGDGSEAAASIAPREGGVEASVRFQF